MEISSEKKVSPSMVTRLKTADAAASFAPRIKLLCENDEQIPLMVKNMTITGKRKQSRNVLSHQASAISCNFCKKTWSAPSKNHQRSKAKWSKIIKIMQSPRNTSKP